MPITPADRYRVLLRELQFPGTQVLSWNRVRAMLRGPLAVPADDTSHGLAPDAPELALWLSAVFRTGTDPGAAMIALRMAMSLAAERAHAVLQTVPSLEPADYIALLSASQTLAFTGPLVVPELVDQLSDVHPRQVRASESSLVILRQLAFLLAHGMRWLAFPRQRGSPTVRRLYSLPDRSSEKFWSVARIRPTEATEAQWQMTHGRIHVSETRHPRVWSTAEALRRLQDKITRGYWESAETASRADALPSLRNLSGDLLRVVQRSLSPRLATTLGPLWYALLVRALPVREGLAARVVLGHHPTLPFQGSGTQTDAAVEDAATFAATLRHRLYGPTGQMGTTLAEQLERHARSLTPTQRRLTLDLLGEAEEFAREGYLQGDDFIEAFGWVANLDKVANLHLDRAGQQLFEELALRAFDRGRRQTPATPSGREARQQVE